jgi:hypothetical protein
MEEEGYFTACSQIEVNKKTEARGKAAGFEDKGAQSQVTQRMLLEMAKQRTVLFRAFRGRPTPPFQSSEIDFRLLTPRITRK